MKFNHYLLLFIIFSLTAYSSFEPDEERKVSSVYSEGSQAALGKLLASELAKQDFKYSAFFILDSGRQALLKRLAIIQAAEQAIDLQYYIWNVEKYL